MTRVCTVCSHPKRAEIDEKLALHADVYRRIASAYGVYERSLRRHAHDHLRMTLRASLELRMTLSADNLLRRLAELDSRTDDLYDDARQQGDLRAALLAIHEARGLVETYSRIGVLGEMAERLAEGEQQLADAIARQHERRVIDADTVDPDRKPQALESLSGGGGGVAGQPTSRSQAG